ncbi:tail fiber assembly protein, partial [Escherichia coli]|nr:tail fiber assembly protein [Escherichia coli]
QLRLGIISVQGKQKLTEWILYAQKVESTDTSILPVTFPEKPE